MLTLGAYLARTGGRLVAQYGLSQQQSVMLIAIDEQGPVSQKGIRTALLYERSNVSKAAAQLQAMGLIQDESSPDDGRVVLLRTTPEGKRIARACMATFNEWNEQWLDGIPKREIRGALSLLRKLTLVDES